MSWRDLVLEVGGEGAYPLCRHCIDAIKSRGERVFVGDLIADAEECETDYPGEAVCDWCGEVDDLYACKG